MSTPVPPTASTPSLVVDQLTRRFQGLVAVDNVSFTVTPGTIHGLIGPNGAGKTTLFNLISGLLPPSSGTIRFGTSDLTAAGPDARARLGIARTFQNIRMFTAMTVEENVLTGMHARLKSSLLSAVLPFLGRGEAKRAREEAHALLEFVGLADLARSRAGDLAYGDQRRLEIARALALKPTLMLCDEPAAGMNPAETRALEELLHRVREQGITLLVVEHDMPFVMGLCDRVTVVNFGRHIAEGTPLEIRQNPAVIEAYLGAKVAEKLAQGAAAGGAA